MEIERISAPSRRTFLREYVRASKPVVITDLLDDWPAMSRWTPEFFRDGYGDTPVSVVTFDDERANDPDYFFNNRHYEQMTIREYVESTYNKGVTCRSYLANLPLFQLFPELKKDVRDFTYWDTWFKRRVGLKGVFWMGPAGTTTPIHFEARHNFFAQIYGKKRWIIGSGAEHEHLYVPSDFPKKNFSPVDVTTPNLEKYPKFADANLMELELCAGEVLFLPGHWLHYVEATDYSISINFWWHTLKEMILNLPRDMRVVSSSIWRDPHAPIVGEY